MPTTKIISTTAPKPQKIDWSKKQFLKSLESGRIVFFTGKHDGHYFDAWVYAGPNAREFISNLSKYTFEPLQGKVQLEISNEDE